MKKSQIFFRQAVIFSMIAVVFLLNVNAQSSSVDPSFNTIPAKSSDSLPYFELQPDGKILTFGFGGTQIFNGVPKNQIARLNADGSLDNTFDCAACDLSITNVRVQSNGKIIVAGFVNPNGTSGARIRRLNPDGSIDGSFNAPAIDFMFGSAAVRAIQPDGKILISTFFFAGNLGQSSVIRLNADGSIDSSFTRINLLLSRFPPLVAQLRLQADGKILILLGGYAQSSFQSSGAILRFNADGTSDTTFEQPTLTNDGGMSEPYRLNAFDVQSNGNIVIGGRFDMVNSIRRVNVARIMPAGNVDLSFSQTSFFTSAETVNQIKIFADGKTLVVAAPTIIPGFPPPPTTPNPRILRLNADGSLDNTYNAPTNFIEIIGVIFDTQGGALVSAKLSENGATVNRTLRLGANGNIESVLNISVATAGTVSVLASQTDGKTIIGGNFNLVNNVSRSNLARVNADGSLDTTFNPGSGFDIAPKKIVIQTNGKILVGGSFTVYNGTAQTAIARLNADGSLDSSFAPVVASGSAVNSIALRADGKIYIGGTFNVVNGQTRSGIALLNADGSLDATFNPTIGNALINSIALQSDGKVVVGGTFSGVNGFSRTNLVRLNADGTLDAAFNAGAISTVNEIKIQADGKYVVLTTSLVRLNNTGTTDTTFQAPSVIVNDYLLLPDGSIIIGGVFSSVSGNPQPNITRLRATGSIDITFLPNGANAPVNALARAADGKVLVGGSFTMIGGVNRIAVARLTVNPIVSISGATPFDFDGDGRADVSVFRPSNGVWYLSQSAATNYGSIQFGLGTDKLVPADYDGDGKTDVAVVRNGIWYLQRSQAGFTSVQFGDANDVPVPADYDGDGRSDIAVFRPSNGVWYLLNSQAGFTSIAFGLGTDKPVPGDYNGDGKAEIAVFRPSNGYWYLSTNPATGFGGVQFGAADDKLVPADYDGDGKTDVAVFRPSNGVWYLLRSTAGFTSIAFGFGTDTPVAADYDGDGRADVAVFRGGNWYLNRTTQGFTSVAFGVADDKPVPYVFVR